MKHCSVDLVWRVEQIIAFLFLSGVFMSTTAATFLKSRHIHIREIVYAETKWVDCMIMLVIMVLRVDVLVVLSRAVPFIAQCSPHPRAHLNSGVFSLGSQVLPFQCTNVSMTMVIPGTHTLLRRDFALGYP